MYNIFDEKRGIMLEKPTRHCNVKKSPFHKLFFEGILPQFIFHHGFEPRIKPHYRSRDKVTERLNKFF